jgi:FkbM family methyltransferase
MTGDIHIRLAASRRIRALAAAANRIPLPLHRWVVPVLGCRMQAHTLDRHVALWLWRTGRLERFGIANLDRYCGPGTRALDVGANIGFYTLQMARRVGPRGHVYAFEPETGNFGSLERNIGLNGLGERVTCEKRAAAAETGRASLFVNPAHHGDHRVFAGEGLRPGETVEVVRLDDYFAPGSVIDLVKIDVQGAELYVLLGMRRLLAENPQCTLLLEINAGANMAPGASPEEVLRVLESAGFAVVSVQGAAPSGTTPPAPDTLLRALDDRPYVDVVARHR